MQIIYIYITDAPQSIESSALRNTFYSKNEYIYIYKRNTKKEKKNRAHVGSFSKVLVLPKLKSCFRFHTGNRADNRETLANIRFKLTVSQMRSQIKKNA